MGSDVQSFVKIFLPYFLKTYVLKEFLRKARDRLIVDSDIFNVPIKSFISLHFVRSLAFIFASSIIMYITNHISDDADSSDESATVNSEC